ncbi:hypothetical protein FHP29_18000 [Nocardioides albidus]|uniref:Uncharacterized protein n=1 Tax=Nocardioides albidus TaxID=1517589 RepID=A0A5C4VPD5_9ACTN|nr:hypothetical protein [Nocardioides albidus]TNM37677.1 hypothetical protein FHP29_18000 [Nocardioides albidus]
MIDRERLAIERMIRRAAADVRPSSGLHDRIMAGGRRRERRRTVARRTSVAAAAAVCIAGLLGVLSLRGESGFDEADVAALRQDCAVELQPGPKDPSLPPARDPDGDGIKTSARVTEGEVSVTTGPDLVIAVLVWNLNDAKLCVRSVGTHGMRVVDVPDAARVGSVSKNNLVLFKFSDIDEDLYIVAGHVMGLIDNKENEPRDPYYVTFPDHAPGAITKTGDYWLGAFDADHALGPDDVVQIMFVGKKDPTSQTIEVNGSDFEDAS